MFYKYILTLLCSLILICVFLPRFQSVDPGGYIAYCPCMGRFGNQADHFLGSLRFAKELERTLILPPWVEYRYAEPNSTQVPFDTYFEVEPLLAFHRVVLMEEFMREIAPKLWPPQRRTDFCYSERGSNRGCDSKEGNPFGPFWDTFNISFVHSEFYEPLHYDVHHSDMVQKWNETFPATKYPVLAFTGAPAAFPVQKENVELQKFLKWNKRVLDEANEFIKTSFKKGTFIGIHLRNGVDWVRACEYILKTPLLFAAPQCLGYTNSEKATPEICFPSEETVIKQVKRLAKSAGNIVAVVVASDSNHMIGPLTKALARMEISVVAARGSSPHIELSILGMANHFIGNCISSFTAFVKRERDVRGLPSAFWAYPIKPVKRKRDEL